MKRRQAPEPPASELKPGGGPASHPPLPCTARTFDMTTEWHLPEVFQINQAGGRSG